MQLSYKVHELEKAEGSDVTILTRVNPYLRIAHKNNPPLFIQKGAVFSAGGEEETTLPAWFLAQLQHVTDKALSDVGYTRPVKKATVHKEHKPKKRMKRRKKRATVTEEDHGDD